MMRTVRLAAVVVLVGLLSVAFPQAAAAEIVSPAGACTATATWTTGGRTAASQQLKPSDVIEIPRKDTVSWSAAVVGPTAGTPRAVSGRVSLRLPPPFGAVDISRWSGPSAVTTQSGSYTYSLPSLVPAGVVFRLDAAHDEAGKQHCAAQVGLRIAGGPFDSPLTYVGLGLLLGSTVALLLLGRSAGRPGAGRIAGGAVLGIPFGLFAGVVLVLFGVVSVASPLVTVLPIVGLVAGAAWTWWSPLGHR
jgi:hypothetical protein